MKHFELNWKSTDGLNIFAQGWEPDDHPFKAVVCLVHGIGEHTSRYEKVAEAFTKKGYILFGADMRGHGKSEGIRGHISSMEAVLQDIDALISKAHIRYPELPVILYGHSLGGILVLHYTLKRKPDVEGVISTSAGLHNALEKQPVKILAAKVLGSIMPKSTISNGLDVTAISHDKNVIDAYQNDPLVHDRISLGFGKIMIGVNKWTQEHAGEFSLPLLLLHGKADTIAFPSGSIEFAEKVPKSRLVLWDKAFHELHNEPEKEEVFKTMTDWMDELLTI